MIPPFTSRWNQQIEILIIPLGLFHNVHCKISINLSSSNPAYNILLERPFDVLTTFKNQNYVNGNQTITISDPNSHHVCTVPTFHCSCPCFTLPVPLKIPPLLYLLAFQHYSTEQSDQNIVQALTVFPENNENLHHLKL